ncbi:MAG: hypothetical protein JNM63_11535, partial [Spirochaetia bacterium]|nr:hypothetical protein [Spirochaetia bacterium]
VPYSSRDAILDTAEAKEYLGTIREYPIPLGVALPLFSWGAVYQGKIFRGLMRDFRDDRAPRSSLKKVNESMRIVKKSFDWEEINLMPGNEIRIDSGSAKKSDQVMEYLNLKNLSPTEIALFCLGSYEMSKTDEKTLESLYGDH